MVLIAMQIVICAHCISVVLGKCRWCFGQSGYYEKWYFWAAIFSISGSL